MKSELLEAPEEVHEFYRQMELLYRKGLFHKCHIYNGRKPHFIPNQPPQLCSTPGCINPRHWANQRELRPQRVKLRPPSQEEMRELLFYYLDSPPYPQKNFQSLREAIPKDILTDKQILEMLNVAK